ncbi:Adenosine kinase 2 [Phytophthora rubi]|uniref:Adenosine kinase n=1 Tax=Phytophthora rubi TaxID=129364 RepID=A0A6A4FZU7_9STRA|nr:Adenosine kinase 2 [Phytophthora rubi]KAE9046697.1 Adenosine kinase 2 [Phytophthora rubi]KAE9353315.1 Adenosine kinase 2 [Phytophthora rubi]
MKRSQPDPSHSTSVQQHKQQRTPLSNMSSDNLTHAIVGLGNPLLDISADVTAEFLAKYDLKPANAILADESHAPMFAELVKSNPVYVAGGATQNSIRVAQWMLNKHNKSATSFFGSVGKDAHGAKLKECAEADGVNVSYLENADIKTGTCAVCVVESERSLVADLSAANHFHHDHLAKPESQEIINKGQYFYSAGFHLTVSPTAVMTLAEHAKANNKTFLINLSAPFIVEFFKEPLLNAIKFADFVFGNESEAKAFGKVQGWGEDVAEIALKTAQLEKASGVRCRTVVFTQGADATILVHQGKVFTYDVPKLAASSIVDTNGAGDAFVGGFVSRLALGLPFEQCVNAGHWAAQVVLARSGCTFPENCEFQD